MYWELGAHSTKICDDVSLSCSKPVLGDGASMIVRGNKLVCHIVLLNYLLVVRQDLVVEDFVLGCETTVF